MTAAAKRTISLNPEQSAALEEMKHFVLHSPESFFVLSGSAGTGKTTCIRELLNIISGRVCFTAPTNKATRVLADSLRTPEYEPDCCTIYSLLGLRMEPNGSVKVLSTPDVDKLDISHYRVVVIDEAGMINSDVWRYVQMAAGSGVKFILMGDAAQLPPVKESRSPIWDVENCAKLEKVMRHDNQILTLATKLRKAQGSLQARIDIRDDHDEEGGVWKLPKSQFLARITEYAREGKFSEPGYCKALAWRNVTVNELNTLIRAQIFESRESWLVGDRIISAAPANDLDGNKIANTDDEGTVESVSVSGHPLYPSFSVYVLGVVLDTNKKAVFRVLHERDKTVYEAHKARLESAARTAEPKHRRRAWGEFWAFVEAFHDVRYGYAVTVHRSQGSTYEEVFVDSADILMNRNRTESLQCLYVACTRPKRKLHIC